MKNSLFVTIVLFLFSTALFSQNKKDIEWIEDIDYLVNRIELMHPDMYANISEKEFKENTQILKDKVPGLGKEEVLLGIMELVASLKDGHTSYSFEHSNILLVNKNMNGFPFTIYAFSDGLFIIAADKKYEKSVGKKVIKFGNLSSEEAVERISKYISADNEYGILNSLQTNANHAEILYYSGISNSISEITLELEDENGEIESVVFKSKGFMLNLKKIHRGRFPTVSDDKIVTMNQNCSDPLPMWLSTCASKFSERADNYWFKYLEEQNTYYLQINQNYNKNERFADFINRMFTEFDENKAEKLIIDIRLNNGGNHFEMPLFKGIVSRPNLDKPENLFLLTSRVVFSASQHLTNLITNYTNATLMGEPTSSKPNFYGSPLTVKLPNNSAYAFRVSTIFFKEVEPLDRNMATYPNYFVPYRSEDFKNNIDPVLEKIFSLNSKNQFASFYKEKLKKAYINGEMIGLKEEYHSLKNEILKQGISLNDILFTDFDLWMVTSRKSDENYIEYLEFLDQEFPNDYRPTHWLANWIDREKKPEKVMEYYRRSIEINPTYKALKLEYELLLFDEEKK